LDCIECGCCSYVCPSHIPLVDYFSFAKALHRKNIEDKRRTDAARERFEYREFRLERNNKERTEMMEAKKKAIKEKMANEKGQKDKIAAAMDRVNKNKEDNAQ
jgi:electron transport complex protein RnfC